MQTSDIDTRAVLRELTHQFCEKDQKIFDNVLIVAMQHILQTTVDMLAVMKEQGLQQVVIGGKKYSTHQESAKEIQALGFTYVPDTHQLGYGRFDDCMHEVAHNIWSEALKAIETNHFDLIIVLDDGLDLLRTIPGRLFNSHRNEKTHNKPDMIIGIEQTRAGANHPFFTGMPFPIINVAGSFVKTQIEYPKVAKIIGQQIITAIQQTILQEASTKPVVGILGYGTMGQAIAYHFVNQGFSVGIYDKDNTKRSLLPEVVHYDNSAVLIANSDIIIGCTGSDITAVESNLSALLYSREKKWLISAGSKDHEFNTLLRIIQSEAKGLGYLPDIFQTIRYENTVGSVLEILRGGFPINFTNEAHSVSPEHIWPTRAALLLACLSAVYMRKNQFKKFSRNTQTFMLPTEMQYQIIKKYGELNADNPELKKLCALSKNDLIQLAYQYSDGDPLHIVIENATALA